MRYTRIVLAAMAFAATLLAADPFAGTWKLDPAKSKFKTGAAPKEQMLTITESGADLDIVVKGAAADGKPISTHITIPAAGGPGKSIESPYDAVSGKRMGPDERVTMYSKGGKVVYTTRAKVAGKMLTVSSKGTNPVGQEVDGSLTYEKQ